MPDNIVNTTGSPRHLPREEFAPMRIAACLAVAAFLLLSPVLADGPADNNPANVKRIPALGVEVPEADRNELIAGLANLNATIAKLRDKAKTDARTRELLPDVLIYSKAVHDALEYREFFVPREIAKAKLLLDNGQSRAMS